MFTAAEFALIARRHMHLYGTTPEQIATVAATIRNNGHVHPDAVYSGRGPFTPQDILDSPHGGRPVPPARLRDDVRGRCALVLTRADIADDLRQQPVYVLGGNTDHYGPSYQHPPSCDLGGHTASRSGRRQRRAPGRRGGVREAGLGPDDVDVCEFYDPFSFEIIRQFEAFGFCGDGEGGDFVMNGTIEPGGRYPVTTDGGADVVQPRWRDGAVAATGASAACEQLRGECATMQVADAEVAMCSGGGSGALFTDVMLLGKERP